MGIKNHNRQLVKLLDRICVNYELELIEDEETPTLTEPDKQEKEQTPQPDSKTETYKVVTFSPVIAGNLKAELDNLCWKTKILDVSLTRCVFMVVITKLD